MVVYHGYYATVRTIFVVIVITHFKNSNILASVTTPFIGFTHPLTSVSTPFIGFIHPSPNFLVRFDYHTFITRLT